MNDIALRNILSKMTTLDNRVSMVKAKQEQFVQEQSQIQSEYARVNKQLELIDRQFNSLSLQIGKVGGSFGTQVESFSKQLMRCREECQASVQTMLEPTLMENKRISQHMGEIDENIRLVNDSYKSTNEILQTIQSKVERLQKLTSDSNGYIASNNFMCNTPSSEQLTNFVMECLQLDSEVNGKESIPNGTKIKNTFDNHIWVFNRVSVSGLTTCRWQDFGSDTICVAGNDGVYGLVTGSDERYEGKIDLRGIITINGLKEDVQSLMDSIQATNQIVESFLQRLVQLESRVRSLEDNK